MTAKKKPEDKLKTGRPTKYKPEYCEQITEYFKDVPENEFRLLSSFAHTIGVTHKCLWEWSEQYPEFGNAYARAKEMQEQTLVNRTLTGKYNPQFAIMTAKNVCGWRDKQDIEQSGSQTVTVHVIDRYERPRPKSGGDS